MSSKFKDQVLEQRGIVGELTKRTYHPLQELDAVKARVDALIEEGFTAQFEDYSFADLAASISDEWPGKSEMALRNELWEELDAFLADTGLGYVSGGSSGSGTMELELSLVDVDLARERILNFVKDTKFATFNKFRVLSYAIPESA